MKKTVSFFLIFLLFGFLTAETALKDLKSREAEIKPESESQENASSSGKKPKWYYLEPAAGIGFAVFNLNFDVTFDSLFLVKHTKKGLNLYLGPEIGFRYFPALVDDTQTFELPIQAKFAFDSKISALPYVSRFGIWVSLGVDLIWEHAFFAKDYSDNEFKYLTWVAWSLGFNFVLENNVIIKFGFADYFNFSNMIFLVGYRF